MCMRECTLFIACNSLDGLVANIELLWLTVSLFIDEGFLQRRVKDRILILGMSFVGSKKRH